MQAIRITGHGNSHAGLTQVKVKTPPLDSSVVECFIYTFKDGLLSGVAHDLKLQAPDLKIEIPEEDDRASPNKSGIEARVILQASGIRCVAAMKNGVESPESLSAKDLLDIRTNMARDVLKSDSHPEIRFELHTLSATANQLTAEGALTLCGVTRRVAISGVGRGDAIIGEFVIHQPDFGIKPFSALLGAMKVKPDILIQIHIPISYLSRITRSHKAFAARLPAELRDWIDG